MSDFYYFFCVCTNGRHGMWIISTALFTSRSQLPGKLKIVETELLLKPIWQNIKKNKDEPTSRLNL